MLLDNMSNEVKLYELCSDLLIALLKGACIVRDATGIERNDTLTGIVNCTDAACKFGYDFNSCKQMVEGGKSPCKFGLHHDFQVHHQQQTVFLHCEQLLRSRSHTPDAKTLPHARLWPK